MNSKERVLFSQEAFNWGTPYSAEPIKQMYTYEGLLNMYLSHDISSEEFLAQRNVLETQNTDWFKLLTRRAFSHNHNLSVSRRNKQIQLFGFYGIFQKRRTRNWK